MGHATALGSLMGACENNGEVLEKEKIHLGFGQMSYDWIECCYCLKLIGTCKNLLI